jgi:hypothetical protein
LEAKSLYIENQNKSSLDKLAEILTGSLSIKETGFSVGFQ